MTTKRLLLESNLLTGIVHSLHPTIMEVDTPELQLTHPALDTGEKLALVPIMVRNQSIGLITAAYTKDNTHNLSYNILSVL